MSKSKKIELEQANILRLIFNLTRFSAQNAKDLHDLDGYLLIRNYLRSDKSELGFEIAHACLSGACSDFFRGTDCSLLPSNTSVICNVDILEHVLLDRKIWGRAPLEVWQGILVCLAQLVDPEINTCAAVNVAQIRRANAIPTILSICQDEHYVVPCIITLEFVRLLYLLLVGADNDETAIIDATELWTFLVASHPTKVFQVRETGTFAAAQKRDSGRKSNDGRYYVARSTATPSPKSSGCPSPYGKPMSSPRKLDNRFSRLLSPLLSSPKLVRPNRPNTVAGDFAPVRSHNLFTGEEDSAEANRTDSPQIHIGLQETCASTPKKIQLDFETGSSVLRSVSFEPACAGGIAASPNPPMSPVLLKYSLSPIVSSPDSPDNQLSEFMRKPSLSLLAFSTSESCNLASSYPDPRLLSMNTFSTPVVFNTDLLQIVPDFSFFSWWSDVEDKNENSFVRLGMLRLLVLQVSNATPSFITKLHEIITPMTLLSFLNHDDADTRSCVVHLIDLLLRIPETGFLQKFLAIKGFHLLGSQLRQFEVTEDIVAACCNMFTGQMFEERVPQTSASSSGYPQAPPTLLPGIYRGQPVAVAAVLAMFDSSMGNPALCLSVLTTIRLIFVRRRDLQVYFIQHNLLAILCDVIMAATLNEKITTTIPDKSCVGHATDFTDNSCKNSDHDDIGRHEFNNLQKKALLSKAELLLVDLVQYACSSRAISDKIEGFFLIKNMIDCLSTRAMPVYHSWYLQQVILRTALELVCYLHVTSGKTSDTCQISAKLLCSLALDVITYSDTQTMASSTNISGSDDSEETGSFFSIAPAFYGYRDCDFSFFINVFCILRGLIAKSDSFSDELGRLVLFLMAPSAPYRYKAFVVNNLSTYPNVIDAFKKDVAVAAHLLYFLFFFYKALTEKTVLRGNDELCNLLSGVMKYMVETQKRMIHSTLDIDTCVFGENYQWKLTFFHSAVLDRKECEMRNNELCLEWKQLRENSYRERCRLVLAKDR